MTRCLISCKQFLEPNGEIFCWEHGTVEFKAQPSDLFDLEMDKHDAQPYSDKFVYMAATRGTCLDIHELSLVLKMGEMQIARAVKRYQAA